MSAPCATSSEGESQPSPSAPANTTLSTSPRPLPPASAPAPAPFPAPFDPVPFLTDLLSRPVRLTLRDRRTLLGLLASIDSDSLILTYTEEFPAPGPPLGEQSARERAVRESVERYWPRSEGFGGPTGTGWGGRGLGMVLVKLSDVDRVELMDEEEGEGGEGVGVGEGEGGRSGTKEGPSIDVDGEKRGEETPSGDVGGRGPQTSENMERLDII